MSRTNKSVYDFITSPDRFKAAATIADQMDTITADLWDDFIEDIRTYLQSNLPQGWSVIPTSDKTKFDDDREHLAIYNNYYIVEGFADPIFCISFYEDDNIFGLWFNSDYKKMDVVKMRKDIEDLTKKGWKRGYTARNTNGEFIAVKKADETFIDYTSFEPLLPSNRKDLVIKYANYLISSIDLLDRKAKQWFEVSMKESHTSRKHKRKASG